MTIQTHQLGPRYEGQLMSEPIPPSAQSSSIMPSIWHYCSMRDLRKIEKLQYKALKYVYNDFKSSYTDLRKMANRPLMYIERQKCILLEVFKCLNQISPRYLHDMFEIKVMPYNLRNESIVILPKYNFIKYVRYSILYDGAALWNALDKKNCKCTICR